MEKKVTDPFELETYDLPENMKKNRWIAFLPLAFSILLIYAVADTFVEVIMASMVFFAGYYRADLKHKDRQRIKNV